jgi:multimeric flavodoxin WrbA
MKIVALVASPRTRGNTVELVDAFLQECTARGHDTRTVRVYDHEIRPCTDCRVCKGGDLVCTVEDDMQLVYPLLDDADLIVFGTPVYFYGPTGAMKTLVDRLRPYIGNGRLKGTRAVIVAPSEEGPDICGPLLDMFRMSYPWLGLEDAGSVLATAREEGEVAGKPEEMDKARGLAARLAS